MRREAYTSYADGMLLGGFELSSSLDLITLPLQTEKAVHIAPCLTSQERQEPPTLLHSSTIRQKYIFTLSCCAHTRRDELLANVSAVCSTGHIRKMLCSPLMSPQRLINSQLTMKSNECGFSMVWGIRGGTEFHHTFLNLN